MNFFDRALKPIFGVLESVENYFVRGESDPYEVAKYILNIRLSLVFLVAGLLYAVTFIPIGHFHIFIFATGISLCFILVPFTLKHGFNSKLRNTLVYVCSLFFVVSNVFGSGNALGSIIILWMVVVVQIAIATLRTNAALIFSVLVIGLIVIKQVLVTLGFVFPFFIPREIVLTPRFVDLGTPIFFNLFMFYNTVSLGKRAQNQAREAGDRLAILNKTTSESEHKYRVIVEQSLGYISIHDEKGHVTFVNNASAKALGFEPEELRQKNIKDILHPSVSNFFPVYVNTVLTKGIAEGIMKVRTKSGEVLYWLYRNVRLDNKEAGTQVIGFAHDITELENTRRQLITAREQAEESDRLKSAFLANMSHEIRTPMNAIIGFSELLEKQQFSDEKRREFTWHIRERSKDLLHIINNILDFSRLEAGNVSAVTMEGDIDEMMTRLVASLEAEINYLKRKQVTIQKQNALEGAENIVKLDFLRLNQVLSNLLSNALKFTPKGEIVLSCRKAKPNLLEFSVTDTGIGIEPSKRELIFKPFRQADDSIHRKHGGSGLGLAICKGLVEMWGGNIFVDSYGSGSCFTVTIPFEKLTPGVYTNRT